MSKIEVNQIDTISGSSTLLVGPSAATKLTFSSTLTVDFNVNSPGVTLGADMKNTPAFEANRATDLTLTNNTTQKMTFDTKIFDTDNCYDATTNYRFTPTVAGKYFVYSYINFVNNGVASSVGLMFLEIYKNGSRYRAVLPNMNANNVQGGSPYIGTIVDMNGTTDYLEIYVRPYTTSGTIISDNDDNAFGAYRIIGA